MTEHTPGPWKINSRYPATIETESGLIRIAQVRNKTGLNRPFPPEEEARSNARLIAAAPDTLKERDELKATVADLLEYLQEALDAVCDMCKQKNPQHADCTSCFETDRWREAIRKAEGQS